jgi:branched-chain amino acid aminotransferase
MEQTKYIWLNGKVTKWNKAYTHVITHALHYGSAVFEGIRAYETEKGPAIFRLEEHTDRLINSANALNHNIGLDAEQINQAIVSLTKKNKLKSGYIRPLAYFGEGKMGLDPKGAPNSFLIAMWPWGKYLGKEAVDTCIVNTIRLHPKSAQMHAKVSGYYVNSIQSNSEAQSRGYDEGILLDYEGNIAEGSAENIFFVKEGKIYTPKTKCILPGITRDTIMQIAKNEGIEVIEQDIKPEFIDQIDEAFFTGTTVEVTPIAKINETKLDSVSPNSLSIKLRDIYSDCVRGKIEKYNHFLTYVS